MLFRIHEHLLHAPGFFVLGGNHIGVTEITRLGFETNASVVGVIRVQRQLHTSGRPGLALRVQRRMEIGNGRFEIPDDKPAQEREDTNADRGGERFSQEFIDGGNPKAKLSKIGASPNKTTTGTTVSFWPDPTIFASEGVEFVARTVTERLQTMAFLRVLSTYIFMILLTWMR